MGREKKAKTKFKKVVSEQFPVNPKRGGGILKIEAWENKKGEIVKYSMAYMRRHHSARSRKTGFDPMNVHLYTVVVSPRPLFLTISNPV